MDVRARFTLGALLGAALCAGCTGTHLQGNAFSEDSTRQPSWDLVDVEWQLGLVERPILEYAPTEVAAPAVEQETGRVVVVTRDGFVRGISPEGIVVWTFKTRGPFSAGPSIYEGVAYVPGGDGTLYALDVKNGSVRWTFAASQELATPPVLVGGRLYFASHNDTVYALEASSGTWKWQYRRDPPAGFTVRGMSTPRVKDGLVYAGFSDGSVVALKAEDGAVRWERVLSSSGSEFLDADGGPVLDDEGQLYVASYRDGIYALDAASGEVRWHTPRDGVTSLVRRPGVIYAAGERGVGAFLQDSGRQVWTLPLGESAARLPVPSHKMLVVPINQALLFVDPLRGKTELAWDPGAGVSAPPAPWGRRLYVLSNTGFLYALKLKGGA